MTVTFSDFIFTFFLNKVTHFFLVLQLFLSFFFLFWGLGGDA